jgi:hypothetical protein
VNKNGTSKNTGILIKMEKGFTSTRKKFITIFFSLVFHPIANFQEKEKIFSITKKFNKALKRLKFNNFYEYFF